MWLTRPPRFAITAGDVGGYMFFVRSGEMDLLLEDNATIVQSLCEGEMFGHIAVVEHCTHQHSVRAVKYSECTSLNNAGYKAICGESEKFEELVTMEAMRQESLINAAKKNVMRFAKLSKMGGSASTEHNDRKRRESVSTKIGTTRGGGGTKKDSGLESMAKQVRSGIERSVMSKGGGGETSGISSAVLSGGFGGGSAIHPN